MRRGGLLRVCVVTFASALAFSACQTDERTLSFDARAPLGAGSGGTTAGSSNGSGAVAGSGGNGAQAGALAAIAGDGAGGESAAVVGGAPSDTSGAAGAAGAEASGGSSGSSTSNTGGSSSGAPSSGGSTGGSSTGGSSTGGGSSQLGCADLNEDGKGDCTQTLLQNSAFDGDIMGWSAEPALAQSWQQENANGQPGSGSLLLEDAGSTLQANGALQIASRQCIRVETYATYDVAARVRLPADQLEGSGGVNVWLYDDDACAGNLVTGETPARGGTRGAWTTVRGTLWVPSGVRSMLVRLVLVRPFSQQALRVQLDDVLVMRRP